MAVQQPTPGVVVTGLSGTGGDGASTRYEVEIDGERWGTCSAGVVAELRLFEGRVLLPDDVQHLSELVVRTDALAWCAATISRRALTRGELARKLRARGHGEDVVEDVLDRCDHLGLVDDERYALSFATGRRARGQGARRIRLDLAARGVDSHLIDRALEATEAEHPAGQACLDLLRKRFRGADLSDRAVRAKAYRFLQARGFGGDEIAAAIADVAAGDTDT